MWQANESWRYGLFNPLDIRRFSSISINSSTDMPIAVFRRRNLTGEIEYQNLQLIKILNQPGDTLGKLDTLKGGFYYVAIENRRLTVQINVNLISSDGILGNCQLNIEYQVSNLDALFTIADPVAGMRARIEQAVQFIASQYEHTQLTIREVMEAVYDLNHRQDVGLHITNAFVEPLAWVDVVNVQAAITIQNQQDAIQRNQRRIIIDKMKDLGVNNKLLETALLSRVDKDYNVVMQQIQAFMQANKDDAHARIEILQWLADNNYISRDQLDPLIQSAIGVVTSPQPTASDMLLGTQPSTTALPPANRSTLTPSLLPPTVNSTPTPSTNRSSNPTTPPANQQQLNQSNPVVNRRRPLKNPK